MASIFKITAPNPSGILPRMRLFRLLDNLKSKPIIWIAGPAGSGKTSLVGSYLHTAQKPHLWYRLDAGDADISSFFYYMGLGARQAAPRSRKPMPRFGPEYILGIPAFTRSYFEELYRRLRPPFVIALDDFQEVPARSQFHDMINVSLSSIPDGVNVFVISRESVPPALTRLHANNKIALIQWEDIRLTEEEAVDVVRTKPALQLSREAISLLHKKTQGWFAGLILLMESHHPDGMDCRINEPFAPMRIFDYFAHEIFQRADPDMQTLLLKTSFLPSVTPSTAEALTGIQSADRILQRLSDHNYFTEMRSRKHRAYLYHPLFREFLLSKARETFTSDEISSIQKKATALLIEDARWEDAAGLLIQAQDWKGLISLILEQAPSFMAQGRSRTLAQWIGSIPEKITAASPWLLYWKGICRLPDSPAESRDLLEQAFELFDRQDTKAGAFLAWSGAVQTFLFEFHDFGPIDSWMDWLDAHMQPDDPFPSIDIGAKVAAGMVGALAWRKPNHDRTHQWVQTALSLAQKTSDMDTALRAYTNSAFYFLWMGEFAECGLLIQQMRGMGVSRSNAPARRITLKVAEAMFYNSMADHREQAIRSVREGLETAEKTGVHIFDPILCIQGLYHCLNEGDLHGIMGFLSKMEAFPGKGRTNSSYFNYFSAWYHFLSDDIVPALSSARKSLDLIEKAGVPISEALIRLTLAQILDEAEDCSEARRQLQSATEIASQTGSSFSIYLCALFEAYLAFGAKKDQVGLEALHRALTLGRRKGFVTMIHFWRPAVMSRLCAKALETDIEAAYVCSLIRKLRLVPEIPSMEIEKWPWPIRIYTLGRFNLVMDGEPVKDGSKAKRKPLLLLKALIALGGRGIQAESLTDLLWPDAEGDAGHHAFTTTLARLRRILGAERAVRLRDGRVSLDDRLCWVDRWVFEKLYSRVKTPLERDRLWKGNPAELNAIASKAADLYRDHFLSSDADKMWTVLPREQLRNKHYRLIAALAACSEQRQDYEAAAGHYQRGLETDPLAEDFYRGLISAYIRLGRRAEALTAYRQCKRILKAELGIAPSARTTALREQILTL